MTILARESWTFSILSGAETAMIGWHVLAATASDLADVVSAINAVTDPWADVRDRFSNETEVTERTLTELDPATGGVLGVASLSLPSSPVGQSVEQSLPPQIAEVVSIHTATPGRSGRGRIYWPSMRSGMLDYNGRLPVAGRDDLATAMGGYFNGLSAGTLSIQAGVWSRTNLGFSGWTRISVGDVFDTQRGRRKSLTEARVYVDHA